MKKGFTLIEMLVVISLIGVLAALAVISYTGVQKTSRDTQRKSDIKQYQNSLEVFSTKNGGLYPTRTSAVSADTTLCGDLLLTNCPSDPRKKDDSSYDYKYQSDAGGSEGSASATKYVLWAKIESSPDYWVSCSNGKIGTKSQSGFSVSGGDCPL